MHLLKCRIEEPGVPEILEGQIKSTSIETLVGKVCKECGNATLIENDGCEFCTNCGAIWVCG